MASPPRAEMMADIHQLQKLQAMNQELVAKNLSLEIANEQLSETLMQIRQNPQKNSTAAKASDSDVVKNLREELEACQEHLAQKKELLAEALTQLKVFLKDEEMLESEIGENERLAQEVEDFKYDLEQSERARKWLAQRLSATVESFQRLSVKYLMQKVFGSLVVNTMNEQAHRREIEQVKNKCVVRWKSGQVAGAFDKWHASCARREELKRKFAKIIQRWKNMGISVSFSTWAALTAHIKTLHRRMRNIVAKWRNRCTGAAFQRWVEQTAEQKRLQNLTFRIFARWKNKIASSVFWAWAGYIADIKAMSDVHGGTNRVRSLTYRMTFDPKKSDPAMMNDQTRFQMSIFADVSQALAEVFKATDGKEATTQVRIKNMSQKDRFVEIEYCAAQACDGPTPMVLADEITRQVKDSWSKLRLVGKFSGFASGHTLLHENVVKITKVEVILMQEYLLMWHRQAHKQKRDQEKYRRIIKRMKNMASVAVFESWLDQSTKSKNMRNKCIQVVQRMKNRDLDKAFHGFASVVDLVKSRRLAVKRTLLRWKTPYAQRAFDHWVEWLENEHHQRMNDTFEMTRAELEEKRDNQAILLDQEVQRRTEMAQRVVKRMLKGHLAQAFTRFCEGVEHSVHMREVCRKVLSRMTQRQLAGAFECYADHVTTVKEQRKRVESTLSMWKHPGLRRCMQGWLEYMDIVAEERMEAGREAIRQQMHEMAEQMQAEGVRGQELVQSEAHRRIETCKRTIKRMQQHHLSMSWNEFVANIEQVKHHRALVAKVVARMTHRQLAGAFDCYAMHVEHVREQRERVQKTIGRWRTPGLKKAFDRWLDYVDITGTERAEEAQELAKQELLEAVQRTHHVIDGRTYSPGLLLSLIYNLEIENVLSTPATAEEFSRAVVLEIAQALDIPDHKLSVLSYQRHSGETVLAHLVVHDWNEAEGYKQNKSLDAIVEELQIQVQTDKSKLRKSPIGKNLEKAQVFGSIGKYLHDSIQKSYTGLEIFQRLTVMEQEMTNIEKDLHKALIRNVQLKRRTVSRMMHIEKAVAFDTFIERIRSQSDLSTSIQEAADKEQAQVQTEADRRIETCKRTIKRMLKHHLSMAWNEFVANIEEVKHHRALVAKVVARMTHRQLAGAFDCYAMHVEHVREQRERVQKTIGRWRTPGLKKAFDRWLEYMDVVMAEHAKAAQELAKQELLEAAKREQSQVQTEADRRIETCKRTIKRMLKHHLSMAWNEFVANIEEVKHHRALVAKVLARMTHRQLAGAFDCYSMHVEHVREQRERVQKTIGRWRTPGLKKAFDRWLDYVDITRTERAEEAQELAKQELHEAAKMEKSQVQAEADRRIETCKRTIKRMQQHHLSMAWNEFVANIEEVKHHRALVAKVLARMTHRQLAGAFDCYAMHVEHVREQRERVQKTIGRWRTPGLKKAFDRWLDYVDITRTERAEEAQELAKQELHEAAKMEKSQVQAEADRRIETCKRTIKRMQQHHLSMAWNEFVANIEEVKHHRALVAKVLARMTHRQLAGAFDCYAMHVEHVREQRERVQKTIGRWRTPGLKKAFDRWLDYVDITRTERAEEAQELAKQELHEAAKTGLSLMQAEADRRIETCKRTIKRMLKHHLSMAWNEFVANIEEVKHHRALVAKVVARMTHRQLAGAFDCYSMHVEHVREQRERVQKTIGRWRTPGLKKAFDRWLEYMDVVMAEHAKAAQELAKQELLEAANARFGQEQSQLEGLRAQDVERRKNLAKRYIARMLRYHLAMSWTSFVESLRTTKKNRELVRRVLGRIKHQQLSRAFSRYSESVKDHLRVELVCARVLKRMKQSVVFKAYISWRDCVSDELRKKLGFERGIKAWRRTSIFKAWNAWRANVMELRRMRRLMAKVALKIKNIGLYKPYSIWKENVKELLRMRRVGEKVILRLKMAVVFRCFSTWHENMLEHRRLAAATSKIIIRWRMKALSIPYTTWKQQVQELLRLQRAASKVVRRWQGLTMAIPFTSWHENVTELKRLQQAAGKIVKRWQSLALSVPFSTWNENVTEHKRLQRASKKIVKRWQSLALSVPFSTWNENVSEHKRLRRASEKIVKRWQSLALSVPFSTWNENVSEHKRLRRASETIVKRWQSLALSVPFSTWQANVIEKKRLQRSADKVVTRWKKLSLSGPFASWTGGVREKHRLQRAAEKVVNRWKNMLLSVPFLTWVGKVANRRRTKEIGSKIIKRWKNKALSNCFQNWLAHVQGSKDMNNKAKKVLVRWTRNTMALAFLLWCELVEQRLVAETQDKVSAEVAALEAQHNIAITRLKEEILKREKADIAGHWGLGQGSKRQQELTNSIVFYALCMWQRQATRAVINKLQFRIQVHQRTISNLGHESHVNIKALNHFELVI